MGGSYANSGHVVVEDDVCSPLPSSLPSISACSSATRLVSQRISGADDEEELPWEAISLSALSLSDVEGQQQQQQQQQKKKKKKKVRATIQSSYTAATTEMEAGGKGKEDSHGD